MDTDTDQSVAKIMRDKRKALDMDRTNPKDYYNEEEAEEKEEEKQGEDYDKEEGSDGEISYNEEAELPSKGDDTFGGQPYYGHLTNSERDFLDYHYHNHNRGFTLKLMPDTTDEDMRTLVIAAEEDGIALAALYRPLHIAEGNIAMLHGIHYDIEKRKILGFTSTSTFDAVDLVSTQEEALITPMAPLQDKAFT